VNYSLALLMGRHLPLGFKPTRQDYQGGYSTTWPCKTAVAGFVVFDDTVYTVAGQTTPMRLADGIDYQRAWIKIQEAIFTGNFYAVD